ncbi:MAG: hypothetical protein IPH12_14265 [Saprospirales bacterium]|nr:hypothetical protein [Saprospirales bacterium]MBK8924062.1 hypothetical protein [Saprospirales bacterium]
MNNIYLFLLVLIPLFTFSLNCGYAQSCYVQKLDPSGIDISQYQTTLETSACQLRDAFPAQYINDFKVFSYGFYLHTPPTTGGIPQILSLIKYQTSMEGEYYMLISKQSDSTGVYTRFFIDLSLPDTGVFSCLPPSKQLLLADKIQAEVEKTYLELGNSPFSYAQAEQKGMEVLKNTIFQIIQGNCCIMTPQEICELFRVKHFESAPVEILPSSPNKPDKPESLSSIYITDYANLDISSGGEAYIIEEEFNTAYFSFLSQQGKNTKIFITANTNFCDAASTVYADVTSEFDDPSNLFTAWYHVWENPDVTKPDTLYAMLKVSAEQFQNITGSYQGGVSYQGCTSAQSATIDADVSFALEMLDTAIAKISRYDGTNPAEVHTSLDNNFGGITNSFFAGWIKLNLYLLKGMGPWAGYDCVANGDGFCGTTTMAYTIWCVPFFDIRICDPYYFSHSPLDRSTTIIHEWVHKYGCNFDLGYDWEPDYPDNSAITQLFNADSFAEFVKDVW